MQSVLKKIYIFKRSIEILYFYMNSVSYFFYTMLQCVIEYLYSAYIYSYKVNEI